MSSHVDFALSVAVFFSFLVIVISLLINYFGNFSGLSESAELRTASFNIYNYFFASKGLPADWDARNLTATRIGIANDINKISLTIGDANGTSRSNVTMNFTVMFDQGCANKTWETTIRFFNESNYEFPYTLYNKSYCAGSYLRQADFATNLTIPTNSYKKFYVYSSPERLVESPAYFNFGFPPPDGNYTVKVSAVETFKAVSYGKLRQLRNQSYDHVLSAIGTDYRFLLEVGDQ